MRWWLLWVLTTSMDQGQMGGYLSCVLGRSGNLLVSYTHPPNPFSDSASGRQASVQCQRVYVHDAASSRIRLAFAFEGHKQTSHDCHTAGPQW